MLECVAISFSREEDPGIKPRSPALQADSLPTELQGSAGEGVDKKEPSSIVGGDVNWCSHYGEQSGETFKNWK